MTQIQRVKTGRSSQFSDQGGGGGLEFLQKVTLVADSTDVTFSGLDGDVDTKYVISFRLKLYNGGGANLSLYFNGLSTNLSGLYLSNVGSGSGVFVAFGNANAFLNGEIQVWAKTGAERQSVSVIGGNTNGILSEIWNETVSNVTSLVIHSDVASAILAGSEFTLYRMVNG